jgi:hypothetical protein
MQKYVEMYRAVSEGIGLLMKEKYYDVLFIRKVTDRVDSLKVQR